MKTNRAKKEAAIKLRRKGKSIREIERNLDIARSTLSGWFHDIELSKKQQKQLHNKWLNGLVKARLRASEVHRKERLDRMGEIENRVKEFTSNIVIDRKLGEIIYSIFYSAEGAKKAGKVEIANTNPKILVALLELFRYLYSPEESRLRCALHLRDDQTEKKLKNYWSKILGIPKSQFIKTQFDARANTPSFKDYKGVCSVYYCDTNLQKRILSIAEELFRIMKDNLVKGG